jgi:hypothetical protein
MAGRPGARPRSLPKLLDDFALQAMDALDTADIYELIVERHRASSTVVTSNREPLVAGADSENPPWRSSGPFGLAGDSVNKSETGRRPSQPVRKVTGVVLPEVVTSNQP